MVRIACAQYELRLLHFVHFLFFFSSFSLFFFLGIPRSHVHGVVELLAFCLYLPQTVSCIIL